MPSSGASRPLRTRGGRAGGKTSGSLTSDSLGSGSLGAERLRAVLKPPGSLALGITVACTLASNGHS